MLIIKYIISIITGFLIGTFPLLMSVIICRVGIHNCNDFMKSEDATEYDKQLLLFQKKRYVRSLLVQLIVFIVVTYIAYIFLKETFIAYIIVAFITLILNLGKSGNTPSNTEEFMQNLIVTKNIFDNKN